MIIINDGSTDKSLEICNQISKKDNRVKVFTKKNEGVSSARNYGKEKACGEYSIFIDSDDFIEKETFLNCVKILNQTNVDILKFSYFRQCGMYKKKYNFNTKVNQLIKKEEYEKEKIYDNILITSDFYNIWNTFFKTELIKDIHFDTKLLYGEDYFYMGQSVLKSNSIYIIDVPYYHYYINPEGATQNYEKEKLVKKFNDIHDVYKKIFLLVKERSNEVDTDAVIEQLKELIYADLINVTENMCYKEFLQVVDEVVNLYKNSIIEEFCSILQNQEQEIKNKKNFYQNKLKKKIKYILKKLLFSVG